MVGDSSPAMASFDSCARRVLSTKFIKAKSPHTRVAWLHSIVALGSSTEMGFLPTSDFSESNEIVFFLMKISF